MCCGHWSVRDGRLARTLEFEAAGLADIQLARRVSAGREALVGSAHGPLA